MDINKIRELTNLMEEQGLTKLEIKEEDLEICLEKNLNNIVTTSNISMPVANNSMNEIPNEVTNQNTIVAPLVGTFYSKPATDQPPYVNVGTNVKKGDVICIIEAMKVMNEITSSKDGIIKEILVKDEEIVEFDQPLFVIE